MFNVWWGCQRLQIPLVSLFLSLLLTLRAPPQREFVSYKSFCYNSPLSFWRIVGVVVGYGWGIAFYSFPIKSPSFRGPMPCGWHFLKCFSSGTAFPPWPLPFSLDAKFPMNFLEALTAIDYVSPAPNPTVETGRLKMRWIGRNSLPLAGKKDLENRTLLRRRLWHISWLLVPFPC